MPIVLDSDLILLVHLENEDDWRALFEKCSGYLTDRDCQKFKDYLAGEAKTIIVEKRYVDKDYRDTFYNFYSKKFAKYPANTFRFHFFKELIPKEALFNLDDYKEHYVGFSVIRPVRVNSIGRTILDPQKLSKIVGNICMTRYSSHLLGTKLEVSGFPYISQDTDVTVCAHASTWMTFRYFSERYRNYREILPYEITQLTGNLSYGRLVPSKGLTVFQVAEIFSNYGFYPEIYFKEHSQDNFYQLLYYYIESGIPVVAGLRRRNHAVTIFGHTSDYSRKPVTGNSADFLTGFVVNDDNYLPYRLILKDGISVDGHCSEYKIEDIDAFIVPLYEKMYLSAEYIDKLSASILDHDVFGVNALSKLVKRESLIKRIYLTSSRSYKMVRSKQKLPFDLQKNYVELPMPKFIWVCELSLEELYSDKRIIGEIIFDATANQHDRFAFLAIHYPDFILFNDRDELSDTPKRFIHGRLQLNELLPYEMYENNLREVGNVIYN